ncbi:MAG: hypothetical protein AB1634_01990 [Thermodesulfobacteriota bacterium]
MRSFILLLALVLAACTPGPGKPGRQVPPADAAGLAVYLTASEPLATEVSFELNGLALFNGVEWLLLDPGPQTISAQAVGEGQMLLGFFAVPPGDYTRLRGTVGPARVSERGDGVRLVGQAEERELGFEAKMRLVAGQRACLLVDWRVRSSLQDKDWTPVLTVTPQMPAMTRELLYVACDDIDTVFVVRMDTNHVVAAFGVRGGPTQLRYDDAVPILYILARETRLITGHDPYGNRQLSRAFLGGLPEPRYWDLSRDGRWAFVTDTDQALLQKIDVTSGFVARQQSLSQRPGRVLFVAEAESGRLRRELVAVAMPQAQLVAFFDPETLEVLEPASLTPVGAGALTGVDSGMEPGQMLMVQGLLHVADRLSGTVTIYDLNRGRHLARVAVGLEPVALLAGKQDRVYVSHAGSSNVMALARGHHAVLKDVFVGPQLGEMARHLRRGSLYVAVQGTQAVAVLDLNSDALRAQIPLPGRPVSLLAVE